MCVRVRNVLSINKMASQVYLRESVQEFIPMMKIYYSNLTEFWEFKPDKKNNTSAENVRKEGNKAAKTGKYLQAFILYSKSLRLAKEKTETMVLAYMKRASLLLKVHCYNECLEDIRRALDHNCPSNRMSELRKIQNTALQLSQGRSVVVQDDMPKIEERSELFECASNCVDLVEDEEFGRFIIASRDIMPGELIAVDEPLVTCVRISDALNCHECGRDALNPVPCTGCTVALYCGEACRNIAWPKYHRFECPIMLSMKSIFFEYTLAMKTAIIICDRMRHATTGGKLFDPCVEVMNTEPEYSHRVVSNMESHKYHSAQMFHLVRNYTSFFEDSESPEEEDLFLGLLYKLLLTPGCYRGYQTTITFADTGDRYQNECLETLGFRNLLKHSCSPNTSQIRTGGLVSIRANFLIKKGEQIFGSLYVHYTNESKEKRQEYLKTGYNIICKCKACENSWPVGEGLQCEHTDENRLERIRKIRELIHTNQRDKYMLERVLQNLKTMVQLTWTTPSVEFAEYENAVKECHNFLDYKVSSFEDFVARVLLNAPIKAENILFMQ